MSSLRGGQRVPGEVGALSPRLPVPDALGEVLSDGLRQALRHRWTDGLRAASPGRQAKVQGHRTASPGPADTPVQQRYRGVREDPVRPQGWQLLVRRRIRGWAGRHQGAPEEARGLRPPAWLPGPQLSDAVPPGIRGETGFLAGTMINCIGRRVGPTVTWGIAWFRECF